MRHIVMLTGEASLALSTAVLHYVQDDGKASGTHRKEVAMDITAVSLIVMIELLEKQRMLENALKKEKS